jgi:tRNA A-37 threonylcarbamoyl transferase component Bud32
MSSDMCPYGEENLLSIALGQQSSDEMQAHLAGCSVCQHLLYQLREEAATLRQVSKGSGSMIAHSPASSEGDTDRSPGTIGKYFIVGQLGQGAQATTYRALHPELHKELVVKYAKNETGGGSTQARTLLLQEGRALARLDHANIARIYDLDFHDGRPFLVMEYHTGVNLEQFVAHQKLSPRQAAALLIPLAQALSTAHRLGIVHQDIKPANILIDETGKPFLLDFGLARMTDAWSAGTEQPSGGTIAYMSPEQARGDRDRVSRASDIFSLGAVLYFLLTGNPPFTAADPYAARNQASRCDFDRAVLRRKKIPRPLAAICLRAMDPEPDRRYVSADDMAAELERFQRRPHRLIAASALGAALSILIAAVALGSLWPQSSAQPPARQHLVAKLKGPEKKETDFVMLRTASDLARRVPLTCGSMLELAYEVPHGYQSAVFLVNSAGEVREWETKHTGTFEGLDRLRAPAGGSWVIEGPPGPLLFLACANRRIRPRLETVRRLVDEQGGMPLPFSVPQEKFFFLLSRDEAMEAPRLVVETPLSKLRDRLERLREAASLEFEYFWGVAVPVR